MDFGPEEIQEMVNERIEQFEKEFGTDAAEYFKLGFMDAVEFIEELKEIQIHVDRLVQAGIMQRAFRHYSGEGGIH